MPICESVLSGRKASPGWEKDRPASVKKCLSCGTCYPERYLKEAKIVDGICGKCR